MQGVNGIAIKYHANNVTHIIADKSFDWILPGNLVHRIHRSIRNLAMI
jgi:hypothetical protein